MMKMLETPGIDFAELAREYGSTAAYLREVFGRASKGNPGECAGIVAGFISNVDLRKTLAEAAKRVSVAEECSLMTGR